MAQAPSDGSENLVLVDYCLFFSVQTLILRYPYLLHSMYFSADLISFTLKFYIHIPFSSPRFLFPICFSFHP